MGWIDFLTKTRWISYSNNGFGEPNQAAIQVMAITTRGMKKFCILFPRFGGCRASTIKYPI